MIANNDLGPDAIALVRYHDMVRLYVQQDANFNVTAVTDSAGVVLERYLYEPYGSFTVLNADWSADEDGQSDYGQTHLHQGGRYDAASGLYHFRNRDYSPSLGRWVQQDPMGYVDGMSLYQAYAGNSVGRLDSSGLFSPSNHVAITNQAFRFSGLRYSRRAQNAIVGQNKKTDYRLPLDARYHAQDIGFVSVVQEHMARLKKLDASGFKGQFFNLSTAQRLVGETMHTLQDVYAHTDWVDGRKMIPVYRQYMTEQITVIWQYGQYTGRRWPDFGETDLIKKAEKNEPHDMMLFSLEKLSAGDSSDFTNTIFYTGGYKIIASTHDQYATDHRTFGRAKEAPYGLGPSAFDTAYAGGLSITQNFLEWIEKNVEPCALNRLKRGL